MKGPFPIITTAEKIEALEKEIKRLQDAIADLRGIPEIPQEEENNG